MTRRIYKRYLPTRDFSNEVDLTLEMHKNELTKLLFQQDLPKLLKSIYRNPNVVRNMCVFFDIKTKTLYQENC